MGRIRTIKPEMPHSESLGRVCRDARLLFLMLFTIADDEGRGRGVGRLLASTLFPFDDDAKELIEDWLLELERENCIVRYIVDGNTYFQIIKWTEHQKIDKPTPSRFPAPSGLISENRSERQIELLLYNAIERSRALFGQKIIEVQRQVRVGSRYLDIVAKTETTTFVLEIKKTNLTNADLEQVMTYCALVNGSAVLVGPSISAQFDIAAATKAGAAVITFDAELNLELRLANDQVTECSRTLANAIERQPLDLVPRKGRGPRTKEGTTCAEPQAAAAPEASQPEPFITLQTNIEGEEFPVYEPQIVEFESAYPAIDVRQQLREMRAWGVSNQRKRKTCGGMLRFVNSWLAREQNKPHFANGGARSPPKSDAQLVAEVEQILAAKEAKSGVTH